MPNVKMPMASWESVIMGLEMLIDQGYLLKSECNEIRDQVYAQEA